MSTIFYGMQVPTKQNEQLKAQVNDFQKQQTFLKVFAAKLSQTKKMLDKINMPGVGAGTEVVIASNIDSLRLLGLDTVAHGKLFGDVAESLSSLDQALKQLRDNGSSSDQVAKLQQQLNDARRDLAQCQANVALLEKK
jgi:hypothetical protein